MMDQYVTFGDLLKIGSFLLDLISVILYIYYNHKNSNQNHHGKKKKYPPLKLQTWTVISNNQFMGADRLLVCSLYFYYTRFSPICQVIFILAKTTETIV